MEFGGTPEEIYKAPASKQMPASTAERRGFFLKMKNENYIIVQGWQVNRLRLRGNELLLYALIYGFSQDGETEFSGSLAYMSDAIGVSKRNVSGILKRLEHKGLITKKSYKVNGVRICKYVANVHSMDESSGVWMKHQGGMDETSPNNIDNNIESNILLLDRDNRESMRGKEEEGTNIHSVDADDIAEQKERESKQGACPFKTAEFAELWAKLLKQPKWKKKSLFAIQLSAKKLAMYAEEFARELILETIERNYTGVVFDTTPARYAQWINKRNRNELASKPKQEMYREILRKFDPLTATDNDFEQFNKAFNEMDNKTVLERNTYWQKYGDYMDNLNKAK